MFDGLIRVFIFCRVPSSGYSPTASTSPMEIDEVYDNMNEKEHSIVYVCRTDTK